MSFLLTNRKQTWSWIAMVNNSRHLRGRIPHVSRRLRSYVMDARVGLRFYVGALWHDLGRSRACLEKQAPSIFLDFFFSTRSPPCAGFNHFILVQHFGNILCSELLRYKIHIFVDKNRRVLTGHSIFFLHFCRTIIIHLYDESIRWDRRDF